MTEANKLFYKYGSRLTEGVADVLYDKLMDKPEFSKFFQNVDMDQLQEHMSEMLSVITGGPDLYKGDDLQAAHAPHCISNDDFKRFIEILIESIEEVGADNEEALAIIKEIKAKQSDIVSA